MNKRTYLVCYVGTIKNGLQFNNYKGHQVFIVDPLFKWDEIIANIHKQILDGFDEAAITNMILLEENNERN